MTISVVICTWNRAMLLSTALESLCRMTAPEHADWEVVVVDNNSTDATPEVLDRFGTRLPLRRAFEPRPGLSHARNCGLDVARGDCVVWIDDDVVVDEGWLRAYEHAFRQFPDAAVFGGPIIPRFVGSPPAWLEPGWRAIPGVFTLFDLGPDPIDIPAIDPPHGANFALRLSGTGPVRFDPDLGYRGHLKIGGEETVLLRRLLGSSIRGRWVPAARVDHLIPTERQSLRHVAQYFFGYGLALCRIEIDASVRLAGVPRWLWREAPVAVMRLLRDRITAEPGTWLRSLAHASMVAGQMAGHMRFRRRG